jgi:hypothetical protein
LTDDVTQTIHTAFKDGDAFIDAKIEQAVKALGSHMQSKGMMPANNAPVENASAQHLVAPTQAQ